MGSGFTLPLGLTWGFFLGLVLCSNLVICSWLDFSFAFVVITDLSSRSRFDMRADGDTARGSATATKSVSSGAAT